MSKLHKYYSTAHSPQRTVKTLTKVEAKVEDGDYERRREDGDLPFPKLKSLYYYWSLIILIYFKRISVQ
jgi:hypothetical protein